MALAAGLCALVEYAARARTTADVATVYVGMAPALATRTLQQVFGRELLAIGAPLVTTGRGVTAGATVSTARATMA